MCNWYAEKCIIPVFRTSIGVTVCTERMQWGWTPCLLMYSGTSTNGNPEYLISADKRILPSLYVLHRKKGCMSFFVPGHTCVRNGISEVILRGSWKKRTWLIVVRTRVSCLIANDISRNLASNWPPWLSTTAVILSWYRWKTNTVRMRPTKNTLLLSVICFKKPDSMFRCLLATAVGRWKPDILPVHCLLWTACSAKIYLKSWINIIRAVRTLWRSSIRLGLMNGGNVILLLPTSVLPNNWIGCWDMAYLSVCICSTVEQISGIWTVPIPAEDSVPNLPATIMTLRLESGATAIRNIMLSGRSFRNTCRREHSCRKCLPIIRPLPLRRSSWKKVLR